MSTLLLISHKLCPYVQRAVILLEEKGVPYIRRDIDLSNKPDWFLRVSPLGKTPVLLVNDQPIFESSVICEYLDETFGPSIHPADPLQKARHRGWVEFGAAMLNGIAGLYSAANEQSMTNSANDLRSQLQKLEAVLGQGRYFDGDQFSMVDAAFGTVFRYFDVINEFADFDLFSATPKVLAWRAELAGRKSIQNAVDPCYAQWLRQFLFNKNSALSHRMLQTA